MGESVDFAGNSLWPATIVESLASENFQLGERRYWRKATILADCVTQLCAPNTGGAVTGRALVDDEYLRSVGATDDDLKRYRCDPKFEPPRLLAGTDDGRRRAATGTSGGGT